MVVVWFAGGGGAAEKGSRAGEVSPHPVTASRITTSDLLSGSFSSQGFPDNYPDKHQDILQEISTFSSPQKMNSH